MAGIKQTNFSFDGLERSFNGKVRDVYIFKNQVALVATDRISAFDVILPEPIPFKGQILTGIAAKFLHATKDIVPNWLEANPDPNVSLGKRCEPFAVEMVIRGYLAGHAWREYKAGRREICGVALPEGLKENDRLPEPIITPTTKAEEGHDEDISREEIIKQSIVAEAEYVVLEDYTRKLFAAGTEMASEQGLILVDTKYEFGKSEDKILLIDEIHTPDSSRYFYEEGYQARQDNNEKQKQLSKEFVREWLMENGFQGKEGQTIPNMTEEVISGISKRYIELYEQVTGDSFEKSDQIDNLEERIRFNLEKSITA